MDRQDIVDRVFRLKLKALKKLNLDQHILGKVVAYCDTIEFQKRGLPHCHMLFILAEGHNPRTAADTDNLISAEIPDPER